MVLMRVAVVVAWGCVVPAVWCLSLPPPPAPLTPRQHPLTPYDLPPHPARPTHLNRLEEAEILQELDDPTSPVSYRLQQALSQAAAEAVEEEGGAVGPRDAAPQQLVAAAGGEDYVDPRYYVLDEYLRAEQAGSSSDNSNSNNLNMIRKARNSRDSQSSSSLTNEGDSNNNNNNSSSNSSGISKRKWPRGFSRRRSGLSLSIDASMKVLREALYLEIARKKQRQQMQRAQHNKVILNSIGKRDVSAQLSQQPHHTDDTLTERN